MHLPFDARRHDWLKPKQKASFLIFRFLNCLCSFPPKDPQVAYCLEKGLGPGQSCIVRGNRFGREPTPPTGYIWIARRFEISPYVVRLPRGAGVERKPLAGGGDAHRPTRPTSTHKNGVANGRSQATVCLHNANDCNYEREKSKWPRYHVELRSSTSASCRRRKMTEPVMRFSKVSIFARYIGLIRGYFVAKRNCAPAFQ